MADPVGKLDIEVGFDLDKNSLNKISKQVESFHKSLQKMVTPTGSNKDLQPFLPANLKTISKEYQKLSSSLKRTYGFNNKQAKSVIDEYLNIDKTNRFGYRLAQQVETKKSTKSWTLQQLVSKSDKYELLKRQFQEEGYAGGSLTRKLNREFGRGYAQSYEKAKNTKAFKLLKEETKLKQKGLPFLKELGNLKGFSKGLFGVGVAGGVATLAGKMISSYVGGQISKVEDFGAYGTADLSAIKKSLGVIGGDKWSTKEIEGAVKSSFGYMTGKTQDIRSLTSNFAQLAIATGGRANNYIQEYTELLKEGWQSGSPRFREIMELADEIARSDLSKTDQRTLISQMLGSAEIAEKLMTNASMGGKSLSALNKEYYPSALAGISEGKDLKKTGQSIRKLWTDATTNMNLRSEFQRIIQQADEQASGEFGFFGSMWNRSEFQKRRNQLVKNMVDEKSSLIPALQEIYKKEASAYGIEPIINMENNFNVSNDYDATRAGDIIADRIGVNLKKTQVVE